MEEEREAEYPQKWKPSHLLWRAWQGVKRTEVTEYDWMMLGAMPGALALVISPALYLYAELFDVVPIFTPLLLGYQSCVMPFVLVGGLILVQRNKQRWPVWMNVWYYVGLAVNLLMTIYVYTWRLAQSSRPGS